LNKVRGVLRVQTGKPVLHQGAPLRFRARGTNVEHLEAMVFPGSWQLRLDGSATGSAAKPD
jgi:hypothetical protein